MSSLPPAPAPAIPEGRRSFGANLLQGKGASWTVGSLLTLAVSWTLLWSQESYWNPLFFFGLWTSATVLLRKLQGERPFPLPRQLFLMGLSMPLWWWFEFVNNWVRNWQYHSFFQYSPFEYFVFASLDFSTVVPAVEAAWLLSFKLTGSEVRQRATVDLRWCATEIAVGLGAQLSIFLLPTYSYALVWVAPFLVLDGLVGVAGGPNLACQLRLGSWRQAAAIGLAGMACGFFWELWNFGATPKWTYSIPFFHFLQLFEMPLLGYLGYVPFAWSVFQFVQLAERLHGRLVKGRLTRDARLV